MQRSLLYVQFYILKKKMYFVNHIPHLIIYNKYILIINADIFIKCSILHIKKKVYFVLNVKVGLIYHVNL